MTATIIAIKNNLNSSTPRNQLSVQVIFSLILFMNILQHEVYFACTLLNINYFKCKLRVACSF